MTLSKAICTSLKRSSLFLFLLLALLSSLSGASFRVAIVSEEEDYQSLLEDVLNTFSLSISSEYAIDRVNERLDRGLRNTYYTSFDKYLKSEDFTSLDKLELKKSDEKDIKLEIVYPKLSDIERKYILSGDSSAVDYIKLRDGYDMIITIALTSNEILPEISLYIDSTLKRVALYSDSLRSVEEDFLFDLFSSLLLSNEYKVVAIDLPINGTMYVDGTQVGIYTSKLVLKKGEHDISYIVPSYISRTMEINIDDDSTRLELDLKKQKPMDIAFSVVPYDSNVYFNGAKLDSRMIENAYYPFTITATHDGFSLYSIQSMKPIDKLSITLRPMWIDSENLIERAKGEFYTSLFATLITFGGYVASQTISNLMPSSNLSPVSVVLGGISLVSLINMVDSMFAYFNSARIGI